MQLSLSALCVRWSPGGAHFALGSSDKSLSIGYHDPAKAWWTAKLVRRRHASSVLAVAWHPHLPCVATACTDSRCRVLGAALPGRSSQRAARRAAGVLMFPWQHGLPGACQAEVAGVCPTETSPRASHGDRAMCTGTDGAAGGQQLALGSLWLEQDTGAGWALAVAWHPSGAL